VSRRHPGNTVALLRVSARANGVGGMMVGLAGYTILSFRQPPEWHPVLWAALAFGMVPAVIGLVVSRPAARGSIAVAFWWALISMLTYSGISMIRAHVRLESNPNSGQIVLIGLFVSVVYGLMAGLVAAGASALRVRARGKVAS